LDDCISCQNAVGQQTGGTGHCSSGCPAPGFVVVPIPRECANIQQLCNSQPVVYYNSFNTTFPLSGLITVRNTGTCQMVVDVYQSTNIKITFLVPPNTKRLVDIPDIVRIEITCAGDGATLCTGTLTLDFYRLFCC